MNRAFFLVYLLLSSQAGWTQSAVQTGQNEQGNNYLMGGTSMATGGAVMAMSCRAAMAPHPDMMSRMMCFVMGPSLIVTGIGDLAQGAARNGTIDPLLPGPTAPGAVPCELDPTNPLCTHTSGNNLGGPTPPPIGNNPLGNPGGVTPPTPTALSNSGNLPAPVAAALQAAQAAGSQYGVDFTNPNSVKQFALTNGMDPDTAMQDGGNIQASPALQAAIDKAKNDFLNKMAASGYSTSSVAFDSGGGAAHGRGLSGKGDANATLASLMKNLKDQGDRDPASVAGLSKNFNGESIGVAADDIFKIVSRRYQQKVKDKTIGSLTK